jgi:hypothetical protein
MRGEPIGPPWDVTGRDGSNDWEFASAANDSRGELYDLYDSAVQGSRERLTAALADQGPTDGPRTRVTSPSHELSRGRPAGDPAYVLRKMPQCW